MITVNAIGDACPVPVVKTRKAMETIKGSEVVETLVDNEIAVENLKKMAGQMGYQAVKMLEEYCENPDKEPCEVYVDATYEDRADFTE